MQQLVTALNFNTGLTLVFFVLCLFVIYSVIMRLSSFSFLWVCWVSVCSILLGVWQDDLQRDAYNRAKQST
jgi:hypothetical protein